MYAQYGYSLKPDSAWWPPPAAPGNDNNFDVTRAYVNVIGKFADGVTTRITTDVDGRAGREPTSSRIRLKYAFVAWQPRPRAPLTYKLGLMQTPWIDWEENAVGLPHAGHHRVRSQQALPVVRLRRGIDGMWNYEQVNMQVGVYDGEGYSDAPGRSGQGRRRAALGPPRQDRHGGQGGGLRLTGYGQMGRAERRRHAHPASSACCRTRARR